MNYKTIRIEADGISARLYLDGVLVENCMSIVFGFGKSELPTLELVTFPAPPEFEKNDDSQKQSA